MSTHRAALLVILAWISLSPVTGSSETALNYLDKHTSHYNQELIDLINIPSVSSLPGVQPVDVMHICTLNATNRSRFAIVFAASSVLQHASD